MKRLLVLLAIVPTLAFAGNDNPIDKIKLAQVDNFKPNDLSNNNHEKVEEPKILTLSESNTINFNSKFTSSFVAKKQMEAMGKCLANIGSEINIVLYTPGGSVSAGQRFFDSLHALPCTFNTITIFAASMGYQTVQNLGKRYIVPSGILMSHRAYVSGLSGEIGGELDSIVSLLNTNVTELNQIAANRVGISLNKYEELIADELWLTGVNAVNNNHADELVLVKCDKTLSGTYVDVINTMFGQMQVEFSNCPIITGALSVFSSREKEQQIQDYYQNLSKHITTEL
jgi:ATP-dependent protease ClpP protease subunit